MKQAVLINLLYLNDFMYWNEKKLYNIISARASGLSSCGISQGKIISVNRLLCYKYLDDFVIFSFYSKYS